MEDTYLLNPELKKDSYYTDKLSMFLRGCEGVPERLEILISILQLIDNNALEIVNFMDITNDDVFVKLVGSQDNANDATKSIDILNKIGALYGVRQSFLVSFLDNNLQNQTEQVQLTPFEFWLLIKARILQNCYDGTYAQMREYYEKMNLPINIITHPQLSHAAYVLLNTVANITVKDWTFPISNNIDYLFRAGYFTIKSMGISYYFTDIDVSDLAIWDSTDVTRLWDRAKWGL